MGRAAHQRLAGVRQIFFSNCTARCLFCQNYPISQLGVGEEKGAEQLARIMLRLQRQGCHNINLVTPTHWVPQILEALLIARQGGLTLPLLYNTSGYDRPETLRLLEGIVDIYLPDSKYADDAAARRLSDYVRYVEHNRAALLEMARQVGAQLTVDDDGLAVRGLVIRHLVLPGGLSQTAEVLRWLEENLGQGLYVSLMAQYFPLTARWAMPCWAADSRRRVCRAVAALHEVVLRMAGSGALGRRLTRHQLKRPRVSIIMGAVPATGGYSMAQTVFGARRARPQPQDMMWTSPRQTRGDHGPVGFGQIIVGL